MAGRDGARNAAARAAREPPAAAWHGLPRPPRPATAVRSPGARPHRRSAPAGGVVGFGVAGPNSATVHTPELKRRAARGRPTPPAPVYALLDRKSTRLTSS